MTGRHKFSELEARLSPQRQSRITSLADKLGKEIDQAEAGPEPLVSQAVLRLLEEHPGGLTRNQILEMLGLQGNSSAAKLVTRALHALAKGSGVSPKDRKYVAA